MAQENCNNHIVNGTRGRLFEPRSLATNDLVFSNFTSVHGNQHIFIGIDAIAQHNKWVYSSSGEQAMFTNWEEGEPNSGNGHCVHFWKEHPTLWGDCVCTYHWASICEFRSGKKSHQHIPLSMKFNASKKHQSINIMHQVTKAQNRKC